MYKRTATGWSKHLDFIILDMICLQLSFLIAFIIRHGTRNMYSNPLYLNMAIVLMLLEIIVLTAVGTLHNVLKRGYWREFVQTAKNAVLVTMAATLYMFTIQKGGVMSRTVIFLFGVIYMFMSYVVRIVWKKFIKRHLRNGGKHSMLMVCDSQKLDRMVYNLENVNYGTHIIAGFVILDEDRKGQNIGKYEIVTNKAELIEYVQHNWIDEVFIDTEEPNEYPMQLVGKLLEMGIVVHRRVTENVNVLGQKSFIEKLGAYTVITSTINYASDRQLFVKRCIDIVGGLVGCLLTLVIGIFIAPVILLQSPGPLFFTQERVGRNGKRFKIYKFRSMYMDAEERKKELLSYNKLADGKMFKMDWDPRIIGSKILPDGTYKKGIGNFIRDWSLDEFPQFFNVLKGDMSLVGTRPPLVDEVNEYETRHMVRLAIKPGITGMWQVSGRSNVTDFEDVVMMDREYLENWSLGLDIKILLQTIKVVLRKEGSM